MKSKYDLITIGSGPAGGTAAKACADAGLRVALVEYRGFGGTCPLRGCNPKKVLYNAADLVARAADLTGKGIRSDLEIDWQELLEFKNSFVEPVPKKVEQSYIDAGIDVYHGRAAFSAKNALLVDDREISAKKILIAVGAVPAPLNLPGSQHLVTSDDFFNLDDLPGHIVFLGGGYIAFELAHICARMKRRVTILEAAPRPLLPFDPDLVDLLVQAGEKAGIEVQTDAKVSGIEKQADVFQVHASTALNADLVIHGAGRVPDIDDLELEKAGVAYGNKGIRVDEFLQSVSNPHVYAAGDAADTPFQLTPPAGIEGETAAENIINGNVRPYDLTGTPSVVFTSPPMAAVGLGEEQAEQQGFQFETRFADTGSWFMAKSTGLSHAAMKIIIEKQSNRILGAHLLGRHVDEMINILSLAVKFDLTTEDLLDAVYTYPSATRELKDLLR